MHFMLHMITTTYEVDRDPYQTHVQETRQRLQQLKLTWDYSMIGLHSSSC